MFAKITPASLCVCNSLVVANSQTFNKSNAGKTPSSPAKKATMIDTQLKRDEISGKDEVIRTNLEKDDDKAANKQRNAGNGHAENVNNMRNKRSNKKDAKDVNCNTTPITMARAQATAVQPNGLNGKRMTPKPIDIRKEEVMAIRNRFPTKIPIIVQRFCKETALPQLDKSKYLVPQEITMSQFLTIIRNRMRINATQTLYLLVNNRSMISLSSTLAEVYSEYAGVDGFLYVTYASQEVFGSESRQKTTRLICNTPHTADANANESHFDAFLDNTYKSMCFG